jgi:hypothetical protein
MMRGLMRSRRPSGAGLAGMVPGAVGRPPRCPRTWTAVRTALLVGVTAPPCPTMGRRKLVSVPENLAGRFRKQWPVEVG